MIDTVGLEPGMMQDCAALLDRAPDAALDALARTTLAMFGVETVQILIRDGSGWWCKAHAGQTGNGVDNLTFCDRAIASTEVAVGSLDRAGVGLTGSCHLFQAAAPLVIDGVPVGLLYLFDAKPRVDFGVSQIQCLAGLAEPIQALIRLLRERVELRSEAQALQVARRRIALAEQLGGVGQWSLDPDTGRVAWTDQVYRIHGVDPATFDPALQDALAFYEPDSRIEVTAKLAHTLATGEGFDFKALLVRKSDASLRTVLCRGEMRRDEEGPGKAVVFGVFQDVTDQEVLLRQVSDDRERYRLLTRNATDVIATYTPEGVFTYLSPAIQALSGHPDDALLGRTTFEIIHPDDHAQVRRAFHALVRSRASSTRVEYRLVRKDGDIVWVEAHPSPIFAGDGELTGFHDVVRDVSERKAAEVAARQATAEAERALEVASRSEARYRLLADNANDMIATMAPDSTIRFVTPASRRVLGYEPEELIGLKTLALTHRDDIGSVIRFFDGLKAAGPSATTSPYQFRGRHKDGRWIWLEGQPRIEFDEAGRPIQMQDVVRDISARKRLEIELDAARIAAEAAARAKADFLANMSHELRTPLTGILGYADVLSDTPDLPPSARRHVGLIGQAGRNLLGLVNDVLDLSKIEAGAMDLDPKPTDINALLSGAVELFRPQAESKGLSLVYDPITEAPWVSVDESRVRQIVLNLLGNAIKFTQVGQVHMACDCLYSQPGRISLEISIHDTGIGITPDRLEQIFGRFEQADNSTTRRFGGTGLGLAISCALAERMTGRVSVQSTLGQGSTFTLSLGAPLVSFPPPQSGPELQTQHLSLKGLRVLLAEDVAINRELIALLLAKHEVLLTTVEDGAQAVRAASANTFDVVLMDMQMPVLDGLKATRLIRASGGLSAEAPIYALTANVLPEEMAKCSEAGMDGHVGKPFTSETLTRVLKAAAVLRRENPARSIRIRDPAEVRCSA